MLSQQRYEFVASQWGKMSVRDISRHLHLPIGYVHVIAYRLRMHGVKLPKLMIGSGRDRKTRRRGNVNYARIRELLGQ